MSSIIEQGLGVGDVISLLWFKRSLPRYCTKFIEVSWFLSLLLNPLYLSIQCSHLIHIYYCVVRLTLVSTTFELDMHYAVCWSWSMHLRGSQHHCNSKSRQRPCLKSCLRSVNISSTPQTHQFVLTVQQSLRLLKLCTKFINHWSSVWWSHWWRC